MEKQLCLQAQKYKLYAHTCYAYVCMYTLCIRMYVHTHTHVHTYLTSVFYYTQHLHAKYRMAGNIGMELYFGSWQNEACVTRF